MCIYMSNIYYMDIYTQYFIFTKYSKLFYMINIPHSKYSILIYSNIYILYPYICLNTGLSVSF